MPRLSKHQRELLEGAITEEKGKFTVSYAEKFYSTKQQAKESIESLEKDGFLDRDTHGVFKVESLPEEVYDKVEEDIQMLENAKKAAETQEETGLIEQLKQKINKLR